MIKAYLMNKTTYIIGFAIAYLAPIASAMVALGVIVIIDWLLGIIAAYKTKEKITSLRMSDTLIKMLVYYLLIIASYMVEKHLATLIPFEQITLGFVGVIEFLSIGEKFTKITGLPFIKYLKKLITKQFKNQELRDILKDKK